MYNFILKSRPLSYNSCRKKKKVNYKLALESAFSNYNEDRTVLQTNLYAVMYYFFNTDLDADTDNLSKPIWDCLGGYLYEDDQQIKIRTAGSFNLCSGNINEIDFTGLDGEMLLDILDAFDNEEHIVYIECGQFNPAMYKFNLERYESQ